MLLCDDVGSLRALYRVVFEAEGDFVVVGEAANGEAGIAAARSLQPDVVLLDIAMPVMDGLDAIPGILEAAPSTRIVMCTAMLTPDLRERALALGAADYVEKGGDPRELIASVRNAMGQRAHA